MNGKRRKPLAFLECNDCGKLCNGIQGIRGHRRTCPGRTHVSLNQVREAREPVVQPGISLVQAPNQQFSIGNRLDAKAVEVVLCTHESAQALRKQLRDSLPIRQSLDSVARVNKLPTYDDWFDLGRGCGSPRTGDRANSSAGLRVSGGAVGLIPARY